MGEIFRMPDKKREEKFVMPGEAAAGTPPPKAELKFPLVIHHRVIIVKDRMDEDQLKLALAPFKIVEALAPTMSSSSNHYISYGFAALVGSREEFYRLDATLRQVPGVRMVL